MYIYIYIHRAMIARRKSFFHAKKQAMSSLGIQNFLLNSRNKEYEGIGNMFIYIYIYIYIYICIDI
jgi:hypothetical protein